MYKNIKKLVFNTALVITLLAMLLPLIILGILVLGDYRGPDTIVYYPESSYEIGKAYHSYAVFKREETNALLDNIIGYYDKNDYLYVVNKNHMMIINVKKDNHIIKKLSEISTEEKMILNHILKNPIK